MKETINQRIARCRKNCHMTQTEVAEKLGLKCSTYSQMERKGRITVDRIIKLAELFNVSVNYLMHGEEEEEIKTEPTGWVNSPMQIVVEKNETATTLNQPIFNTLFDTLTSREQTTVKMYRNLTAKNKKLAENYIHNLYQQEKFNR